jgi:hypothetical protein
MYLLLIFLTSVTSDPHSIRVSFSSLHTDAGVIESVSVILRYFLSRLLLLGVRPSVALMVRPE